MAAMKSLVEVCDGVEYTEDTLHLALSRETREKAALADGRLIGTSRVGEASAVIAVESNGGEREAPAADETGYRIEGSTAAPKTARKRKLQEIAASSDEGEDDEQDELEEEIPKERVARLENPVNSISCVRCADRRWECRGSAPNTRCDWCTKHKQKCSIGAFYLLLPLLTD